MLGPDEFRFFGRCHRVRPEDWNNVEWPLLWRYHLHYFDDMNSARADDRKDWHRDLMQRWMRENPPHAQPAWDPYPTSLRIVNWIKFALRGTPIHLECMESLRQQAAHLERRIEYHLMGNHLIENARALIFAGAFFCGVDADRWMRKGLDLLRRQMKEQVLEDGGHCERSPMYHQKVLTALLDVANVLRSFAMPLPASLPGVIERMVRWSLDLAHPDGEIALMQDSALDEAPPPTALRDYAAQLGIQVATSELPLLFKPQSGYGRVRSGPVHVIVDVGGPAPDYQPGHAHAGTFGFELSIDRQRIIVDTGVSTYESGSLRNWERGTRAHNTITLERQNSSEVWGAFRVARRARVVHSRAEDRGVIRIDASHDGYLRLPQSCMHRRIWEFRQDELQIDDFLDGRGNVFTEWVINVHPCFEARVAQRRVTIHREDGKEVLTVRPPVGLQTDIQTYTYSPRFGSAERGDCLVASGFLQLPCQLTAHLEFPSNEGAE